MSLASHSPTLSQSAPAAAHVHAPVLEARLVSPEVWDTTISGFDGVCQEQLAAYARLRWPDVTLEPVLFCQEGHALGGALVMLQRLPMGLATIALVKWGPILADSSAPDGQRTMARIVETMIEDYGARRGMMISIMPKLEPGPDNAMMAMLAERGFVSGVGVKYPLRYVVDVTLADEDRLAAFSQKWRYNLRKAMKKGLQFEVGRPDEIGRFMALYEAMSERKMFPDHSGIATAEGLMAMPDGTARPELFFVTHEGETVAGAMIFTAGDTACYLYGATNDAALDLRAGYLLHWEIIRWLRDNTKAGLYDLGGTDGFAGLHQFKSGMVGEAGHISALPPVMNFAINRRARIAGTLAYKAREGLTRGRDRAIAMRLEVMRWVRSKDAKG